MGVKNIIRNLRSLGRDQVVTRGDMTLDHAPDWVFEVFSSGVPIAGGVSSEMDVPGLHRPADNVLMVAACILARRNAIRKVPMRLSDSEGNPIENGALFDLFQSPNQIMGWSQYVSVLETYKTIYNLIAVGLVGTGDKLVESGEAPTEMVPLNPANLYPIMGTHKPTGTPMVAAYRYADQYTGSVVMYEPHQILVYRGFNPHAPLAALAPLTTLRRTMQGDIAAREMNLATMQNQGVPSGVLQNDQPMHKEQAEEVLNFWDGRMRGYQKHGRTMATWGGLKYQQIGLSPQEMEYIQGLKFLRTDYFMIFRVPPEMVYESMPVKMGSGNEAKSSATLQWWQDEGISSLQLYADLHRPVIEAFGGKAQRAKRMASRAEQQAHMAWRRAHRAETGRNEIELWFDENAIPCLVEHRLASMSQLKDLVGLGYRPDDANEWLDLGLPPHPDNVPRVASSVVPVGTPPGASSQVPGVSSEQKAQEGPIEQIERIEKALEAESAARSESGKKLHDFVVKRAAVSAKKWSRFFVEQRGRVLQRIAALQNGGQRADDGVAVHSMLNKIFPRNEEDPALVARLSALWASDLVAGVNHAADQAGVKPAETLTIGKDPRLEDALKARSIQGLRVNDTTEEALRGLLADSFDAGLSTAEIGDKIAEYYAANMVGEESARAQTAAMTQTNGLVNDGRMIAARDVGGLKKYWVHGNPKVPRDSHVAAAQRYNADAAIPLDQDFEVDGYACDAPGDETLPLEEVCNCTCGVGLAKE